MRARGFTLVEVMVALAIVAIALPAVLMALYQQVDDTAYLRDKTMAQMVAANKLAEMRLVIASTRVLSAGKDTGIATTGGSRVALVGGNQTDRGREVLAHRNPGGAGGGSAGAAAVYADGLYVQ